jgi:hypothetical protein
VWAAVLTVCTWRFALKNLSPSFGLDPSWQGTLSDAAASHLHFGTQLVFTYGPLGFLTVPALYHFWPAMLALVYESALSMCVFYLLVRVFRRTLPFAVAVVGAYIAGGAVLLTGIGPEIALPITLVVLIAILRRPAEAPFPRAWWISLGALVAFFPLIKVSLGLGLVVIALVAIVCAPSSRLRAAAYTVGAAAVVFAVGWFGTGNGVGNIMPFVTHAASIATGYSSAMATSPPGSPGYMPILTGLAIFVVLLALVVFCRGINRRSQVGIVIATTVVMWLLAKESFVRFDRGHWIAFFAPLPLIAVAAVSPTARWAGVTIAAAAAVALSYVAAGGIPSLAYRPDVAVRQLSQEVNALSSPGKRHEIVTKARVAMQKDYGIPQSALARIGTASIDISPWEQNVAWALHLRLDALPVPQDYSAYTSALDNLDVADLRSSSAPQFILTQSAEVSVDNRLGSFDPPSTQFATQCRYRQVQVFGPWQLLKRGKDDCGPLRSVAVVRSSSDRLIAVPPAAGADDEVVATFSLALPLSWHVEDVLLKPPELCLTAKVAGSARNETYRFIEGTASDIHIIDPAANINYYTPGFNAPNLRAFSVEECSSHQAHFKVSVHFYQVHVTNNVLYFYGL